jgi:hypothetical protein
MFARDIARSRGVWRTIVVAAAMLALSATSVGVALAHPPDKGGDIDGDGAKYVQPNSHEDAAYDAKLALARAYEEYAATGTWAEAFGTVVPNGPEPVPDPPTYKTLDTRAREQNNGWYCGPAAGQVVINWSRGYFYDGLDGENATKNYKKQSVIADEMDTTYPDGTDGNGVKRGLNTFAQMPNADWRYYYQSPGSGSTFHSWIVDDVAGWEMPLIPSVKPHKPDQDNPEYYLPNWPGESTAKHCIVIRGYNGFWDATDGPKVYYSDSTHTPGRYTAGALTMWKVTSFLWGGTVVW